MLAWMLNGGCEELAVKKIGSWEVDPTGTLPRLTVTTVFVPNAAFVTTPTSLPNPRLDATVLGNVMIK